MGGTQAHRHRCRRRHGPPGARRRRPGRRQHQDCRSRPTSKATAWSPSTRRWWSPTRPANGRARRRSTGTSRSSRPARTPRTPGSPSSRARRAPPGSPRRWTSTSTRIRSPPTGHRGLPAPGDGRAVPARPDPQVQGQTGPQLRAVAVGAVAADGSHRGTGSGRRRRCGSPTTTTGWNCARRSRRPNARASFAASRIRSTPSSAPTSGCSRPADPRM